MSVEQVVETYFSLMRDGNLNVFVLFHEDAVLRGLGMRVSGREATKIRYSQAIESGLFPYPV